MLWPVPSLLLGGLVLRPGSDSHLPRRFLGSRERQSPVATDTGDAFLKGLQVNLDEHAAEHKESVELGFQQANSAVPSVDYQAHSINSTSLGMGHANPFDTPKLVIEASQMFSPGECDAVREEAESKIANGAQSTFTMIDTNRDVAVHDLPQTLAWLNEGAFARITSLAASCFHNIVDDATSLWVYRGLVICYDAESGLTHQPMHRDGSLLSCTVPLNSRAEYDGGGTWVEPLGRAFVLEQGCALLHPSAVRHAGHRITQGTRWVLVLFMNSVKMQYAEHSRRFRRRAQKHAEEGQIEDEIEAIVSESLADEQSAQHEAALAEFVDDGNDYEDDYDAVSELDEDEELQCLLHALHVTGEADHEIFYDLGVHAHNLGNIETALTNYERAVAINDVDPLVLGNMGAALLELGRKRDAFRCYRRALRADPHNLNAHLNVGELLLADGRLRALSAILGNAPEDVMSDEGMQWIASELVKAKSEES